jgi:hypothetical protein
MKLRILGNTLRLRLDRREIDRLGAGEKVQDTISFGPRSDLMYTIAVCRQEPPLIARFDGHSIDILIRVDQADILANTETVGLEADQFIAGETSLRILVEKDFSCLTARDGEDNSGAYDNPKAHRQV